MASFFDIRARQAAAAAAASSSSKTNAPQENNRLQPWVEK
jgi:replication factor C subunit 2/4